MDNMSMPNHVDQFDDLEIDETIELPFVNKISTEETDASDGEDCFLPEDIFYDANDLEENDPKLKNFEDIFKNPKFSEKISTPVKATPLEVLFMVLKFCIVHKLAFSTTANLFSLINLLFETPILPFETKYFIDKFFNEKSSSVLHVTCPKCNNYVGELQSLNDNYTCPNCNNVSDVTSPSSKNLIAVLDPSETIIKLLEEHQDYYDKVLSNNLQPSNKVQDVYDGKMYRNFVNNLPESEKMNYVTAIINTDGAQAFKKSPRSLYPLFLMLNELPVKIRFDTIIPCMLWFNRSKPNISIFLEIFLNLIKKIERNPLQCRIKDEVRLVKLHILMCCADSVARAPMQGLNQFNGRFGCSWCLHPTKWVLGASRYPIDPSNHPPTLRTKTRTITTMKALTGDIVKDEGIRSLSPLIFLSYFNIVSGFIPDYLHAILEGVAKQITGYLMKSERDILYYQQLLDKMKLPHMVSRLTRPLTERKFWKAREWENWVLYLSMPVFSTRLDDKFLKYWSLLVESLYILLSKEITFNEIDKAEQMLQKFVEKTEEYFGQKAMTSNIHLLLHMAQSVRNWGPLWAHSTFQFEAGNHTLLQAVHGGNGVVLQILRYINMCKSATILENHLFKNESEIIKSYCKKNYTNRVKKCVKIGNKTYFGKGFPVNSEISDALSFSHNSKGYYRMVLNGVLYISYLKDNPRSDNSVALLKNGSYIQLEQFIVDELQSKSRVKCRELLISPVNTYRSCTKLKQVLNDSLMKPLKGPVQYIEGDEILSVCVNFIIDKTLIVCAVPNNYYY